MTTRDLRHATIREMRDNRSQRIAHVALKAAWLIEERGVDPGKIYPRLKHYGFPNFIIQVVKQYRMSQRFVLAGVANTPPRVSGSIIGNAAKRQLEPIAQAREG